jgi:hypothetical protein
MAKKNSEKAKIIALSGLGAVLLFTLVYQLFFSSPPPRPTLQSGKNNPGSNASSGVTIQSPENAESAASKQNVSKRGNDQEMLRLLLDDVTPLNTSLIVGSRNAAVSERGNIFEYYVPPPVPEKIVPPPPPPPIALQAVSPTSATAGTPRPFVLTVVGQNIPPDAKIYTNSNVRNNTKRVNETTLSVDIMPSEYSSQANWTIEVKSPSDPSKWYSNPLTFTALAAPEPPFKFIGILGDQALIEITGSKEYLRLKVGGTIQGIWRVDAISNQAMDVTQTQFDIKKRVPLQERPR